LDRFHLAGLQAHPSALTTCPRNFTRSTPEGRFNGFTYSLFFLISSCSACFTCCLCSSAVSTSGLSFEVVFSRAIPTNSESTISCSAPINQHRNRACHAQSPRSLVCLGGAAAPSALVSALCVSAGLLIVSSPAFMHFDCHHPLTSAAFSVTSRHLNCRRVCGVRVKWLLMLIWRFWYSTAR
jgi:hypothetical protein